MLEFAATVDPVAGRRLLVEHRVPIDVLRDTLSERRSPRTPTIAAVCQTRRPPPTRTRRAAVGPGRSAHRRGRPGTIHAHGAAATCQRGSVTWPPAKSSGTSCPTWCWQSSSSAPGGATATTSSVGPPARRNSTSRDCCGSPVRCFTSASLVVVFGHFIGLVIPQTWTDFVGLSQHAYHVQAVILGSIAGISTLAGIVLLIYRRRTTGPVYMATTGNDKLMYVVLVLAIVAGLCATALGSGLFGKGIQLPRDRLCLVPVDLDPAAAR